MIQTGCFQSMDGKVKALAENSLRGLSSVFFPDGYVRLSVLALFLLQDIRVQESAAWFRLDSLAFEKL